MKNINIDNPSSELVKLFSYKEWRQRIHLFDDVYSPGTRCEYEWEMCHLPSSLKNKTFIDVGSNDGMFSFLAESKGASTVKAVDLYVDKSETDWNMTEGWPLSRIKDLRKIKKSAVDVEPCSIYDLKSLDAKFDITFCGNVIAWLSDPLGAIDQLAAITNEKLIIREDISKIKGKPLLEYVNNDNFTACSFNGNEAFYVKYLKAKGFTKVDIIPVDEYKIFERRAADFKKFTIRSGTKIFVNPFPESEYVLSEKESKEAGSVLINEKYFFNNLGWVDKNSVEQLPEMIPQNPIKKKIFENRFKKNMLQNCMIFAQK